MGVPTKVMAGLQRALREAFLEETMAKSAIAQRSQNSGLSKVHLQIQFYFLSHSSADAGGAGRVGWLIAGSCRDQLCSLPLHFFAALSCPVFSCRVDAWSWPHRFPSSWQGQRDGGGTQRCFKTQTQSDSPILVARTWPLATYTYKGGWEM